MAQNATFNLFFLGLGWPWVGEFVGFILIFTCFPTQHNLVNRNCLIPLWTRLTSIMLATISVQLGGFLQRISSVCITVYQRAFFFFFYICTLFSGARGSSSRSRQRGTQGGPFVHHGSSLGPGRAPRGVLWAFKVAKYGKQSRGCLPRS